MPVSNVITHIIIVYFMTSNHINGDALNANENLEGHQRRILENKRVFLDDRCVKYVCQNYSFAEVGDVAFFEKKPEVHFVTNNTYTLNDFPNSQVLTFVNSHFHNFPLNLFYADNIEELDMRNCSIYMMSWENFLMADNLTILLLSENHLDTVRAKTFAYATNLLYLFLNSNGLRELSNDSFKGLKKLYYLDLSDNKLDTLPLHVFSYLTLLHQVNLAGNRLRIIGNELFSNNPRLTIINLEKNFLENVTEYAFQNQAYIKVLDLSHNEALKEIVGNMRLENLWARDCSLSRVNIYGKAVFINLQHNNIMELYFTQPKYISTLNLRDNCLQQIASLSEMINLQIFDVANNPDLTTLPDVWQVDSLERLDLSNTSLKHLPIKALASASRLTSLNVSSNLLSQINPQNFQYLQKLQHFYIHENIWNCYNLRLIMDLLIKPFHISYTHDIFNADFLGEYIEGIKCMYRSEKSDPMQELNMKKIMAFVEEAPNVPPSSFSSTLNESDTAFNEAREVDKLRAELKVIVSIYEQKFSHVLKRLNDLERHLQSFEIANKTMWQHVTITV